MPPRKVKRSQATNPEDRKSKATKPGRKVVKTRRNGGNEAEKDSGRGALKCMLDMPTDIIFEILRRLHPRTLLFLSWTSKSLYTYLMKKSSVLIWRACLKNALGLPPCPQNVIEPVYTAFMFSTHCMACGTSDAALPVWGAYIRLCRRCAKSKAYSANYSFPPNPKSCKSVPPLDMFYKCRHGDWSERSMFYLKREVERTMETWEKLVAAGDEHELAVFIGTEILRLRKVEEHTSLCSEWDKQEAQMILNKRTSDQDERLEEILSRLRTLGWGAEVDFVETYGHTTFFKHKQFRVAERLTEDAWNSMRVGMERCMKNIRFQRLEHELEQRLQARQGVFKDALLALLYHPQKLTHIRLGDIALIPEVREVMCSPADVTVTKDSFDAAAAQMQKHSKEFQRRVQDELLSLLSKLVKEDAKSDADPKAAALQDEKLSGAKVLGLATTCFLCTKCGQGQFYPSVLKHACLLKQPHIVETSDIYGQFVARTIPLYWSGELPVKVMGVLKACEPHACVAKAFELCGKDSRTVTTKEMDALPDLRFVVGERTALTWRAVVLGMFKLWRFKDPDPALRLATPEEVVEVKKEERAERLKASRFTCKLCDNLKEAASGQAIYHLTITHGMNNCQRDCDELESYLPRDTPEANNIYVVDLRIKQLP